MIFALLLGVPIVFLECVPTMKMGHTFHKCIIQVMMNPSDFFTPTRHLHYTLQLALEKLDVVTMQLRPAKSEVEPPQKW
jgi:hypothetical protein